MLISLSKSVASVHFSNRSTIDVAKIPGGPGYQQFMRAAYSSEASRRRNDEALQNSHVQTVFGITPRSVSLDSIRDCSILETKRGLHDQDLGLDSLSNPEKLEESLRQFLSAQVNIEDHQELKLINNLVVMGESADNTQLQKALKKVLGEQYGQVVDIVDGKVNQRAIDPLFAGSRGIAANCWERLEPDNGLGTDGCSFS
jgi:hypothetical protein